MKPLAIDLYCGLGGWAEGFLAEGYRVIGFDLERHDYGTGGYPGELELQDVLTLDGSRFVDAAVIVASPPCQQYSYRAMPWGREKRLPPPDNSLFEACFRIQREACDAAGRHIPLSLRTCAALRDGSGWRDGISVVTSCGATFPHLCRLLDSAIKVKTTNWSEFRKTGVTTPHWRLEGLKQAKRLYFRDGHGHTPHLTNPAEHLGADLIGVKLKSPGHYLKPGSGLDWFDRGAALYASNSLKRKAASAMLAKIPFPLAQHIARCFKEVAAS